MAKNLLDYFFKPESVAVVGASSLEGQVGRILLDNLREGGFPGEIFPVTPEAPEVLGLTAYASLTAVGRPVDLAVIGTPVETAPAIIKECGADRHQGGDHRLGREQSPGGGWGGHPPGNFRGSPEGRGALLRARLHGDVVPGKPRQCQPGGVSGQARQPGLRLPERLHGERHSGVGHPEQHRLFPFHQRGHHLGPGSGRSYGLPGKRDQRQKHPHLHGGHDGAPGAS